MDKDLDKDEDIRLLRGVLGGLPGAWEAFVSRFAPYLGAICRDALRHAGLPAGRQEVEDLLQEVFLRLIADDRKALRAYRGEAPLASYLAALAVHRVSREGRRPSSPPPVPSAAAVDPAAAAEARDTGERLREAMAQLPPRARLAMALHAEGAGLREIGRALGVSKDTAAGLIEEAKGRLRDRLK